MYKSFKNKKLVQKFESMSEILDYNNRPTDMSGYRASQIIGRVEFSEVNNYDEARELATCGWPDGLKAVSALVCGLDKEINNFIRRGRHNILAVSGHSPHIDNFIKGIPENMWTRSKPRQPIIRILYNCSASCDVHRNIIRMRGAATIALSNALESAGYSTEIGVVESITTDNRHQNLAQIYLPVKSAGGIANMDKLAFVLCHPAYLRRILFNVQEHWTKHERQLFNIGNGYGSPTKPDIKLLGLESYDIIIPEAAGSYIWRDETATIKYISDELAKQHAAISLART